MSVTSTVTSTLDNEPIPDFIPKSIEIEGTTYELLKPLTNYRSCHDGTPKEARMVFWCKPSGSDIQLVMKVKVQLHHEREDPQEGPSTTTAAELVALRTFRDANVPCAPHLVAFQKIIQDESGPVPGGFITFTVMTTMPGKSLFGKYWNMPTSEREEIIKGFQQALPQLRAAGIEPIDRGMRNVIWQPETKHVSIIDFELWEPAKQEIPEDLKELQRWGLARRPPPTEWFVEWGISAR